MRWKPPGNRRSGSGGTSRSVRREVPKLAALMDQAEADVLAFMGYPKDHRAENPLYQSARARLSDSREGGWTKLQLLRMDQRFARAMARAPEAAQRDDAWTRASGMR
jgi:hypothetical protein